MRAETVAIHAGRGARVAGEPLNPPLVPASSFYDSGYARKSSEPTHPPGWTPFEAAIGALEGGTAVAFASGMAAISAVLETLPPGAKVVGPAAGYAWTRSLLARHVDARRIELVAVDTTDTEATLRACEGAALLYVETPSNPLVEIAELDRLCAAPCAVAVDGTFATPLLQRALSFGADFAIQSATKFIGGHSDLLLGVVTSTGHAEELHQIRAQLGAIPGALEAYLALRGLRTLPVRLQTAQRNARTLAERLAERHVVHYPGLPGDPGHERATRLMDGYGAMLAFEHPDADAVCRRVRVLTHAKSLGGVESLIERRAPGLLRVSVGCEHVEDLWDDLERAL